MNSARKPYIMLVSILFIFYSGQAFASGLAGAGDPQSQQCEDAIAGVLGNLCCTAPWARGCEVECLVANQEGDDYEKCLLAGNCTWRDQTEYEAAQNRLIGCVRDRMK